MIYVITFGEYPAHDEVFGYTRDKEVAVDSAIKDMINDGLVYESEKDNIKKFFEEYGYYQAGDYCWSIHEACCLD